MGFAPLAGAAHGDPGSGPRLLLAKRRRESELTAGNAVSDVDVVIAMRTARQVFSDGILREAGTDRRDYRQRLKGDSVFQIAEFFFLLECHGIRTEGQVREFARLHNELDTDRREFMPSKHFGRPLPDVVPERDSRVVRCYEKHLDGLGLCDGKTGLFDQYGQAHCGLAFDQRGGLDKGRFTAVKDTLMGDAIDRLNRIFMGTE